MKKLFKTTTVSAINKILKKKNKTAIPLFTKKVTYSTKKTCSPEVNAHLSEVDPEVVKIIELEKHRQKVGIQLIPSENYATRPVLEALGTVMSNKYSEGYPGRRYYGGNEFIDMSESLCQKRALEAFQLDPKEWGVNVQSLSGSPANFAVYSALLEPHERILSLDLPHGGHLSHGYQILGKKISMVSKFFETLPYHLDEKTGLIDYEEVEYLAKNYRPKILVAGTSAYSRNIDYERMRKIANINNTYLVSDMAHISGLVAGGVVPSPFEYSDVVTTTTHKSLRGPRGAMIFFRKGKRTINKGKKQVEVDYDLENSINEAVFPGLQGGPHNHTITSLAVALKLAATPEFKVYQKQVVKNCKALSDRLIKHGYNLVSGGTDNHLILVDLKKDKVDGARVERVLELSNIALNKNTVPGDKSALQPGGIRLGTPAMTTRGLQEADFEQIADFIHEGVKISQKVKSNTKMMKGFREALDNDPTGYGIGDLRKRVEQFSEQFPTIAQ